jgi:hypothetical protein
MQCVGFKHQINLLIWHFCVQETEYKLNKEGAILAITDDDAEPDSAIEGNASSVPEPQPANSVCIEINTCYFHAARSPHCLFLESRHSRHC